MWKWLLIIFASLYVIAFGLYLVGTYGIAGSPQGPLAGVFLMPLGLPWNLLADRMGMSGPAVGILSPLVNMAILYALYRKLGL